MSDDEKKFSDAEDEKVEETLPQEITPNIEPESEETQVQDEGQPIGYLHLGACRFCGQVIHIDRQYETPDEADAVATEHCNCYKATSERRVNKQITDGNLRICRIFGEDAAELDFVPIDSTEIFGFLEGVVEMTARGFISSATIQIRGKCKAKISMTSKEKIKVERTETKTYQLEE